MVELGPEGGGLCVAGIFFAEVSAAMQTVDIDRTATIDRIKALKRGAGVFFNCGLLYAQVGIFRDYSDVVA
jgi:hypothetical protein